MNEDEDLRFYQEVQQYRELRDLEYESWSELLDGEYWKLWEHLSLLRNDTGTE